MRINLSDDEVKIKKVALVGSERSGKSSFLMRGTGKKFSEIYETTIGIEYSSKIVESWDSKELKFQIWDTAGNERFKTVILPYLRNIHLIVLFIDLEKIMES